MGFNGLFTRLHADFSDMLTALAAVNLPDQWRKVDRVREARALQVRRRRGGKRGGRGRRVLRMRRGEGRGTAGGAEGGGAGRGRDQGIVGGFKGERFGWVTRGVEGLRH